MPSPFNSASRAHAILSTAAQQTGSESTASAWFAAFRLSPSDPIKSMVDMATMVGALHDELERVRNLMHATDTSRQDVDTVIDRMQQGLELGNPSVSWSTYNRHYLGQSLEPLKFFSYWIPSEGERITDEELEHLATLIGEIDELLDDQSLSQEARAFINNHLTILRKALKMYLVKGDTTLAEGFTQILTAAALNNEVIQQNKDNPVFNAAIQKVNSVLVELYNKSPAVQSVLAYIEATQLAFSSGVWIGQEIIKFLPPAT